MRLTGFEHSYPHQLSGGMRQRVGLARALAVDADILLMDEPFASVDEQTRRKFQEDLLALLEVEQKTVIFVTHSIEEAVYVSDQIVLLSERSGRVSKMVRPELERSGDFERIRREQAYLDCVEEIWHGAQALSRGLRAGAMTILGRRVPMMASLLVWFVLWEVIGRLDLIMLIPPFTGVVAAGVAMLPTGKFQAAIGITLHAFVVGMAFSLVIGITIGVLMGRIRAVGDVLGMWVNIFESAPLTAIIPVLMAVLGFGHTTVIVTVFLFSVWVIALDTQVGVRQISPSLVEMARSFGAGRVAALRQDPGVRGAAGDPGRRPPRPDPRRQGRGDRPAADRDHRRRRAVRAVLAQLPDGGVLGADHPGVRLRLRALRAGRVGRAQGRVLRRRPLILRPPPATRESSWTT